MPKVVLDRPCVLTELTAAGMAQHVAVNEEGEARGLDSPRDHALIAGGRKENFMSSLASLLHSVGTEESNLYPPRSASDADLADENAFARRVDSKSKSGCAAAPKEVIELFRLGRINEALGQGWHQNTPAELPEAYRKQRTVITGNPQYPQATGKSRKKVCFQYYD